jgi:hypothetical protein
MAFIKDEKAPEGQGGREKKGFLKGGSLAHGRTGAWAIWLKGNLAQG